MSKKSVYIVLKIFACLFGVFALGLFLFIVFKCFILSKVLTDVGIELIIVTTIFILLMTIGYFFALFKEKLGATILFIGVVFELFYLPTFSELSESQIKEILIMNIPFVITLSLFYICGRLRVSKD